MRVAAHSGYLLNPTKLSDAQVMQSINHQIGVCIDAVVGFPCIRIVAGLNGLIDPFAIAQAQQGCGLAELVCLLL